MVSHPARALRWAAGEASAPELLKVDFITTIPHHGLCAYSFHMPTVVQRLDRLKHTALYAADRLAFVSESEAEVIQQTLDVTDPLADLNGDL
eukprot:2845638-Pyramimonas_sp.AAC.1